MGDFCLLKQKLAVFLMAAVWCLLIVLVRLQALFLSLVHSFRHSFRDDWIKELVFCYFWSALFNSIISSGTKRTLLGWRGFMKSFLSLPMDVRFQTASCFYQNTLFYWSWLIRTVILTYKVRSFIFCTYRNTLLVSSFMFWWLILGTYFCLLVEIFQFLWEPTFLFPRPLPTGLLLLFRCDWITESAIWLPFLDSISLSPIE